MLTIIAGSVAKWDVNIVDDTGAKESLSAATAATLIVKTALGGTQVLLRRTADADLTINTSESRLEVTLTQPEADALQTQTGKMIGQASFNFPSGWQDTDYFDVLIQAGISPHTP